MQKIIRDNSIYFYDECDREIMYMDYSKDDCIWYFYLKDIIVTRDMELFDLLDNFMKQDYIFSKEILQCYKDKDKLVWYSDCYYNPDNEFSIASVSCLKIEKMNNFFRIECNKKLDEIIERSSKSYGICFSPLGNGRYAKNRNTDSTLQDDFVINVFQPLVCKTKVLKK